MLEGLEDELYEAEPLRECDVCGATATVELTRGEQSITVCANCGNDGP